MITAVPAPPAPSEPGWADSDLHPVQSVQVGGECPETKAPPFLLGYVNEGIFVI